MKSGVVITIVDADGETSATLHNGADGEKGTDGKSAYQIVCLPARELLIVRRCFARVRCHPQFRGITLSFLLSVLPN